MDSSGCHHAAGLHRNLFCASFGASTIADAGPRAGTLAVVKTIPLFAAHHLAFAADLLGMSLKIIRGIHHSVGFMVFLLGLLHAVVVVASNVSLYLDVTRD
jgi:hypothetical protein